MKLHEMADELTRSSATKTKWSARLHGVGIAFSALGLGLVGAEIISESAGAWFAVFGSGVLCVGLWLSRSAQRMNWRARFLRRRALLADSLGYGDAIAEGLDVMTDSLNEEGVWSARGTGQAGYYSSRAIEGIVRLRDNLSESVMWTQKLYEAARSAYVLKAILTLSCALVMGAGIVLVSKGAVGGGSVVQLVVVALLFFVSAEQFEAVAKWRWASGELLRVSRAIAAGGAEVDGARVWVAFADYAVVTSLAPAIPVDIYQKHRQKLNALSAATVK